MSYPRAWQAITAAFLSVGAAAAMAQGASGFALHTGEVVETMDSAGYTYARVEEQGDRSWIAVPMTELDEGDRVTYQEQMRLQNFRSKTLDRSFDEIRFATIVDTGSGAAAASASPTRAEPAAAAGGDAETYTVGQIYARKSELEGRTVMVRGTVVKVSHNIMNKNWVHIEDGTEGEGGKELIFTSKDGDPAVGAVVTAQGVLETDVDFGYGYRYPVIVQQASFAQ